MPFSLAVFPFQQPRGHHYTLLAKVHADKELYRVLTRRKVSQVHWCAFCWTLFLCRSGDDVGGPSPLGASNNQPSLVPTASASPTHSPSSPVPPNHTAEELPVKYLSLRLSRKALFFSRTLFSVYVDPNPDIVQFIPPSFGPLSYSDSLTNCFYSCPDTPQPRQNSSLAV
jgi:hypothetical protein